MPDALESVAAVSAVDELIVITFPEVPVQLNVPLIVVVVLAGNVTVLGGLIVKLENVLAPVKITAPVPAAVMARSLNVPPPPAKVFEVELVSVRLMVLVPAV